MMRGCACKPAAILQDFPVVKAQEPWFAELPCLMWPSSLGRAIPRYPGHTGAAVPFPGSVWLSLPFNSPALDTARRALPPPRQRDAESGKSRVPRASARFGGPSASLPGVN